jgi:hypothetical protein
MKWPLALAPAPPPAAAAAFLKSVDASSVVHSACPIGVNLIAALHWAVHLLMDGRTAELISTAGHPA